MTRKQRIGNRTISLFLFIAILFTIIPLTAMVTSAAIVTVDRTADLSTMDGWREFFHTTGNISTENAGAVWTDKSVFTNASAFQGLGISQDKQDSFLVALSVMAANMNITGMSSVPSDSMLILDVSGSMNDGDNDVAEELVEAANDSIKTLLSANKHNRVGVVLYSGSTSNNTNYTTAAKLLLPLGRYTTGQDGQYLTYTVRGSLSTTETVGIDGDVTYEGENRKPTSESKDVSGATYIQRGIVTAMNEFLAEGNSNVVVDPSFGTIVRKPVIVLMSDGAPSLGSTNFTDPGKNQGGGYNLGNGSNPSAELGFVTQLTAAYAKAKIEEKYGTDALFYTLGLGLSSRDSIAISVMDPDNANGDTAVDDFWNLNRQAGWFQSEFKGYNHIAVGETVPLGSNRYVTKIDTALEQNYVDRYFAASTTNLVQVFQSIMSEIQLQSAYFPTLISQSEDLSGYVSFVDKIGEYMSITDIKGIVIGDHLFSGADLASNFVEGGGKLGTYDNPSALGMEMVAAVRARLGIDSDATARTLIGLAYANGQLSYTNNSYSNYIGWYANAAGEFLGFYNEGTTVLPAATGNEATDPAFVIRSYGYLGEVDESLGVSESDMMYATVQVRKDIATGEELVTFAVPAALIPIISYNVTLDETGELSELTVSGADNPIRLVYEVALDEGINSFNMKELLSDEYLADPHNVNDDGTINFYTNRWDHDNKTEYGTVNTYAYFNPSRQNEKYYYLEDAPVYTDANGTLYIGSERPSDEGTFYRSYKVYKNNGTLRTETVYRELSDAAKSTARPKGDGSWYIPEGNVHVNLDGYTVTKRDNLSGTIIESSVPFVDTTNHEVDDLGYEFYVGATLGNNGKLTVMPETGIKLSKSMADGVADPGEAFTFDIFNITDAGDGAIYPAWLVKADGTTEDTSVYFDDGSTSIELDAGDTLYIGGMTSGETFRIEERETAEYIATATGLSQAGTVTVNANELLPVSFVNDVRGTGNLTIAKEVEHDFGQDYNIPADMTFTVQVTLSGIGTYRQPFTAEHSGNSEISSITTDENGQFTVTLKHDEQLEVFGLPAGTEVTVVEQNPSAGFTPSYWDNGILGDGKVTVLDNNTVSVIVVNDYEAKKVYGENIHLGGDKVVKDENGNTVTNWPENYKFDIVLEKYDATNGWVEIGRETVDADNKSFSFNDVMATEEYSAPGVYSYQMYEEEPEIDDDGRVNGMIYDITWHTFSVYVSDYNMDGQLEIVKIHSDHANKDFEPVDGIYTIDAGFENAQTVTVPALATVEIQKILENDSGSTLVSWAGYSFGLYTDPECLTAATIGDGIKTIGLNPTDSVGEGWIDIQFDQSGTYTFYVKEIAGNNDRMSYSETVIKIVVTVHALSTDASVLVADVDYYTADGQDYDLGADGEVEFINTYDPVDTELTVDFVKKELSGRDLISGEFTFEVQNQAGTKILEGTNGVDGKVTFNGTLKFDKVGTYFYNIVETSADGNGVTVDKTTYRVTVTVTDVNGQLTATPVLVNAIGNTIIFKNSYTTTSTEHSIVGTKVLDGRTLLNDEFSFVLTEVSYNGDAISNPQSWTVKNFASENDNIVFPTLTYDKAGTYVYTVNEVIAEGGASYGISYDQTQYQVTVVIKDDGEGALFVDSETVSGAGNTLKFENIYKANPTSAQFNGEKQLTGKVNNALQGGEYEFELYNSDENWTLGSLEETVENGAGGVITFKEIDFDTDEDQYFIVVEKNGGLKIDGVTYDDTEYRVWVEITDDLKGQLRATIHIYDVEGIPKDRISFVNVYEVTGSDTVTLSGEKFIDGRDFEDGDSFTFELYETDENYVANDLPMLSVDMDPVTHKYSISLNYTAEDIGNTYYYVLNEKNGGDTVDRLTYSNTEYQIKVVVEDNGTGGVKTTVTVVNATTTTLNFVNVFVPKPADITVDIDVIKTVVNEGDDTIGPEDFEFLLENLDSDADGDTVKSDENGMAKFTLTFTEDDIGNIYTYKLTEIDDGRTGVTYSTEEYIMTVAITLDEDTNTLVATLTQNEAAATELVGEFENIYNYTTDVPDTGDNSNMGMWLILMFISGGAVITLFAVDKKKRIQSNE